MKNLYTRSTVFIFCCSLISIASAQDDSIAVEITGLPTGVQNGAFEVTITFSEAVSGFETDDIAFSDDSVGASVTNLTTNDNTIYTAEITPDDGANGDVKFKVSENVVKSEDADEDAEDNNTASDTHTVKVDLNPPTVVITDVPSDLQNDVFDITITFSEAVNGFVVPSDLTVTGPAVVSLKSGSDGDNEYEVTITPNDSDEGDVTIQVLADAVTDNAGNGNIASSKSEVPIDTIPPTVEITGVPDIEKNVAFDITITFSEAVNGLVVPSDLTVTGPAVVSLKSGSDGDTVYVVTLTPNPDAEGDLTIQVLADAVTDVALNNNTASVETDPVRIDTIVPRIDIITNVPTTEQNMPFEVTITFSEEVTGFEAGDIIVPGEATATGTSESGAIYTATITPNANKEDDITIQVKADAVTDNAGNANTEASDVTAPIHIDTIPPEVLSIIGIPDIEKNAAFDVTITFSEPVNNLQVPDNLTVNGPATAILKSGSNGDTVYVVTLTPNPDAEGDLTIQVPMGAARDPAMNGNTASAETDPVHVDTMLPTVEISAIPQQENNKPFDLIITFTEEVNGFQVPDDLTVTGPAVVSLKSGSDGDNEYEVTITPNDSDEGDVTIQVKANVVKDFALNDNTASAETTPIHIDTIPPTVQITDVPQDVQLVMFSLTIAFSEDVLEFQLTDIILTGDAVVETSELTGSGSTYTLTITPHEDTDGDVTIEIPADVAEDEATNLNTASVSKSVFVAPAWIPDVNFRTVVREELGLDDGEDFAREQLSDLITFNGFYREINDLRGLEHATDLISLELTGNLISDLMPLSDLTTLTMLMLDNNAITDITPLEGLTYLTTLNLAANQIGSITPLEDMTGLHTLNLGENLIKDLIPLATLTALTHLYLTSNDVQDVSSLVNLKNLVVLEISGNPIQDLDPLAGLAREVQATDVVPPLIPDRALASGVRRALKLGGTVRITIADLQGLITLEIVSSDIISSLSGLEHATALTTLVLSDNFITDITSLTGLTQLTVLNLGSNAIIDIAPLADLRALTTLDLGSNSIIDIMPLEDLTGLTTLNLSNNLIENFQALTKLTSLTILELSGNAISDLEIISGLTGLRTLNISDNSITDITLLQDLTKLTTLNLSSNTTSNLNPISHLTKLTVLDFNTNSVRDLTSIRDLHQLTVLDLSNNTVSDVTPLAGLTNLTTLGLAGNTISDLNPITTLVRLKVLDVSINDINDVSPLTLLTQLAALDITSNDISDVQPLVGLVNLRKLSLEGNPILDATSLYPLTQRVPPVDIDIRVSQYPPWDINEDGSVNAVDSALVTAALGQTVDSIVNPRLDVNGDGMVDSADLLLITENLDTNAGAPSAVSILAELAPLNQETLEKQLQLLITESDGSLKYLRAMEFLQSLLAALSPDETVLLANYPNPFNPETWIPYQLRNSSDVKISIYDVRGVIVRHLDLGHQRAGSYIKRTRAAYWDGRNGMGEGVASGIYFYQLQADSLSRPRKMVILK